MKFVLNDKVEVIEWEIFRYIFVDESISLTPSLPWWGYADGDSNQNHQDHKWSCSNRSNHNRIKIQTCLDSLNSLDSFTSPINSNPRGSRSRRLVQPWPPPITTEKKRGGWCRGGAMGSPVGWCTDKAPLKKYFCLRVHVTIHASSR